MVNRCMIDLETLGVKPGCAVVQIGACTNTSTFKATININEAMKYGNVEGPTLTWWLQQSAEARKSVFNVEKCIAKLVIDDKEISVTNKDIYWYILDMFKVWIDTQEINEFWAHAAFDFPILEAVHSKVCPIEENLFNHWKLRDLRTIEAFSNIDKPKRTGTHHDALDDAKYQMECLNKMLEEF